VKKVETPHIEKVVVTQHGPIISGVMKGTTNRIALNSMALRPSQALQGYLSLNKAKNWNEFVDSVRLIDATQLNMTYADVEDNIGYWVTGKVPIRAERHIGNVPVPGWTGDYEWQGEIPFDSMPYALNPQEGYLITCNHKIIPDDFPYFLGDVWMNGYRAKRFIEFFEEKGRKLSLNDFKELMLDVTCIPGKEFKLFIQGINLDLRKHAKAKQALTLLGKWNGVLSSDSVGGTIYQVLRYNIVLEILKKGLGKELTFEIMGNGFHPVLYHTSEFYGHDTTIMMRLLRSPDSWWISQVGGVHEILIRNLVKTISWLEKEYGKDEKNWKWGALHRVHFPHAMGLKKPLDQVFDRGNLPIGGDTDTLCQTAIHPETPYDVNAWAPSHRQIINLNDLSKSLMIFAPGQSGHLASKHYDDLIQLWYNGEYHPMLWEKKDIIENAEGHLILFTN
jgi:penicillin amidase